jgi:hypothetical protein
LVPFSFPSKGGGRHTGDRGLPTEGKIDSKKERKKEGRVSRNKDGRKEG